MTLTVTTLHRQLGELIERGHGRKPVCIDKGTFHHPLESDGAVILGVESVSGPRFIQHTDDDGGGKTNADGSESGRCTVILSGGYADSAKGGEQ